MAESLCVSLACYTYANLQIILGWGSGRPSTEELAIHCQSSWPRAGGLIMEVKYKEGRQKFPLSPPFAVWPSVFHTLDCSLIAIRSLPIIWLTCLLSWKPEKIFFFSRISTNHLTYLTVCLSSTFTFRLLCSFRRSPEDGRRTRIGKHGSCTWHSLSMCRDPYGMTLSKNAKYS
jgi:hypothetical protein